MRFVKKWKRNLPRYSKGRASGQKSRSKKRKQQRKNKQNDNTKSQDRQAKLDKTHTKPPKKSSFRISRSKREHENTA